MIIRITGEFFWGLLEVESDDADAITAGLIFYSRAYRLQTTLHLQSTTKQQAGTRCFQAALDPLF